MWEVRRSVLGMCTKSTSGLRIALDSKHQSLDQRRRRKNDTADHKDTAGFARAGQGRGQAKGTFRKCFPSPPPPTEPKEGKPNFSNPNNARIPNKTFFSNYLHGDSLRDLRMEQGWEASTLRSSEGDQREHLEVPRHFLPTSSDISS